MVFSKLVTDIVDFGQRKSNPRGGTKIIGPTPHHMAGRMMAADCARMHYNNSAQQSANYYIGYKGDYCGGVSEDRRAWTSSSRPNDFSHITIEVSNDQIGGDWHISDASYLALIKLSADICKRYGIKPYFTGSAGAPITYHQMFDNTDCPGPYLKRIIDSGKYERDILAAMGQEIQPEPAKVYHRVQVGAFSKLENAQRLESELQGKKYDTYLIKADDGLYKVQVGAFAHEEKADNLLRQLKGAGYNDAWITTKSGIAVRKGTGRKSNEEIAAEVRRGDWGNYPERKERLEAAGYDYAEIQRLVNRLYG